MAAGPLLEPAANVVEAVLPSLITAEARDDAEHPLAGFQSHGDSGAFLEVEGFEVARCGNGRVAR